MIKRLTRSGNSLALVIDRPLLEALIADGEVGDRAVHVVGVGVDHSGRLVDVLANVVEIVLTRRMFDNRPENEHSGIAVAPSCSRFEGEGFSLDEHFVVVDLPEQLSRRFHVDSVEVAPESGGVGEEVLDANL